MKFFSKVTAVTMTALMLVSLAACGGGGNNFTCADVTNKSDTQQLWLKSPESQLVINPDAVGAGEEYTDARDMTLTPLCIGVNGADGNLADTYNDIFFVLEAASANGMGGNVIYEENFDDAKGLSKAENRSSGNNLQFTIPSNITTALHVKPLNKQKIDYNNDRLYLVFTIAALPEGGSVSFYPAITADSQVNLSYQSYNAVGTYAIKLADVRDTFDFKAFDDGNLTGLYFACTGPGDYSMSNVVIQEMPVGYKPATKAATTEWTPYSITSSAIYPQTSAVKTVDFFFGANAVARKIVPTANGSLGFAGKIKGTCTYDEKANALLFDTGAAKYAVFLKRKGTIEYYANYEDLLSGQNVLEAADGAAYWALSVNDLTVSDENDSTAFYVAVGASATMEFAELIDAASDAISVTKAKKTFSGLEEYWDNYIAANDVSGYITVFPEK